MTLFDLEQQILDCWNIVDDVDMVCKEVLEGNLSKDEIANLLMGIHSLYSLKFDNTFKTFERLIRERAI